MKRRYQIALGACILLGLVRVFDLLLWTDPVTGFAKGGAVWRYLLLLPALGAIYHMQGGIGRNAALQLRPTRVLRRTLMLAVVCAGLTAGYFLKNAVLYMGVDPLSHHMPAPMQQMLNVCVDFVCVPLFALLAVWLLALDKHLREGVGAYKTGMLLMAMIVGLAFCLTVMRDAVLRSSSVQRITVQAEGFGLASVMLFFMVLPKALFTNAPFGARRTGFWGMVAFLMGFCLLLPQGLYRVLADAPRAMGLPVVQLCGAMGLLGAVCAYQACSSVPVEETLQNYEGVQEEA